MQIVTCPPYEKAVLLAKTQLYSKGVIVYPTDTLYGLGCDALCEDAIKQVMHIKNREENKQFSVIFESWNKAEQYVEIDTKLKKRLQMITPGPYTFLLKCKKSLPQNMGRLLGCRIVDNEFCKRLCKEFDRPIVSTSANISKGRSPINALEVESRILEMADLTIDDGETKYKQESTIIDVPAKKILRSGSNLEQAQKWLKLL